MEGKLVHTHYLGLQSSGICWHQHNQIPLGKLTEMQDSSTRMVQLPQLGFRSHGFGGIPFPHAFH